MADLVFVDFKSNPPVCLFDDGTRAEWIATSNEVAIGETIAALARTWPLYDSEGSYIEADS